MAKIERKKISQKTTTMLWFKAGGRCEYCNVPLWKDSLTQKDMNKAYISHIVAASSQGPRGHWFWSPKLEVDFANLLLLCDECHNRIDKSQTEEHSVERLRMMKNEHEERIERLCAYKPENKSHVVMIGFNIGNLIPSISLDSVVNSMLKQGIYPSSDRAICLGVMNSETKDSDPEYWKTNDKQITSAFDRKIRPLITETNNISFSVFGLAPQPLLVRLGVLLSDLQRVDVYQKHREPDTWDWLDRNEANDFKSIQPPSYDREPILIFAISANAISERIQKKHSEDCDIWVVTADKPGNDMLRSKKQLMDFRTITRATLDNINANYSNKTIKVFMAMPVACAIELGRVWMPKADLPMVLYEYNTTLGLDYETIIIKNE